MGKLLAVELWRPSAGFFTTKTSNRIIKEAEINLSILAGPGAGKTEILAQRANFLLQTGVCKPPQKILALSLKVDAASNIKKRVGLRCTREQSCRFESSTFDSFFMSIVRRFVTMLPAWISIPADFDICRFDDNWWRDYERSVLNGRPCDYRSTFTDPDCHSPLDLSQKPDSEVIKIWNYCTQMNIVDYSMCRSMAYTIVKNHGSVRVLILSTYKFLFLDEFQDTTDLQYKFIQTVFGYSDVVITAVGDTNQMIMGFAGANLKNFSICYSVRTHQYLSLNHYISLNYAF